MSIGRLVNLVGLCLLLSSAVFAADTPPIPGSLGATPGAVISAIRSPWQISIQPAIGSESEQNPQLIGVTLTRRDTFEVLPVVVCYKPNDNKTLVLTLPYVQRSEELLLGSDELRTTDSGLGDVVVGLEHSFMSKRLPGWDSQFEFSLSAPTGKNVYDNLSETELPMGIGHYQTTVSLGCRRLSDPVIVSAGLSVGYLWPRERNGQEVRPGFGFTLRTGIGCALSDRWILTEELEFTRQPNVFLQSAFTAITETVDQAYITHGFVYNRSCNSPSYSLRFSIGLNNQSTDFMVTLGANQ